MSGGEGEEKERKRVNRTSKNEVRISEAAKWMDGGSADEDSVARESSPFAVNAAATPFLSVPSAGMSDDKLHTLWFIRDSVKICLEVSQQNMA